MHDIVSTLGPLLVSNLAEKRAHGTLILSTLIQTLPFDYLTSDELHFLFQFYADRTKDNHQVSIQLCYSTILATNCFLGYSSIIKRCVGFVSYGKCRRRIDADFINSFI